MKTKTYSILSFTLAINMLLAACSGNAPAATDVPVAAGAPVATAAPEATQAPAATATVALALSGDSATAPTDTTATPPPDAAAANPTPAGNAAVVVDTGFRPETNGFAIPNYGDIGVDPATNQQFPVVNLTSVEMRRLFGDGVCGAPPESNGTCALTPPADQWMQQNNASMNGGHCEGFAVLSQLIYAGTIDPKPFGADRTIDLKIQGNEPLQRELAYWFSTQGPTWEIQQTLAPKDLIDYLKTEYTKDAKNIFRLGIMKEDKTGGHAITAYEVKDQGNGVYWVMVYDNNYPSQERHMTVDYTANTWEYEAAINPTVQPDIYKGGPDNTIFVAANQPRLTTFPCPFCNTAASSKGGHGLAATTPQFNEIFAEGYINVELQDEKGRKIGYDEKGKFVNEIPEAKVLHSFNGTVKEVLPTIHMPTGMDFTAYLWGDDHAAEIPASLVMVGKGFYVGVEDLVMAPGQEDQLFVDGAGDAISYKTDAAQSPTIIAGIEKPGADFELVLKAVKTAKGTDIAITFDQKEDTFAFQTTSDAPAKFNVSITRLGTDGKEETFDLGDTLLDIDPGKLTYFYFGKWGGQGSNLEMGYDKNGDGKIEDDEISNMADAK